MDQVHMCHLDKAEAFNELCRHLEMSVEGLQFDRLEVTGEETVLRPATGGMKVFWIYSGEGDVFLPAGHRTKEGDGHALPPEYRAEAMDAALAERLALLERALSTVRAEAQSPVQAILARRRDGAYVGDFANDLWKLEHAPRPWSDDEEVDGAISFLFGVYRECGHSVKNSSSYERVMAGDQLVVAGDEHLRVRGRFSCVTVEQAGRVESHVPAVMRLRYLRDSSGGCNFDFDPFRRLPLTWYMNLPGETGDGLNFVNSHVVNIAKETSPTHFHPVRAIGGGLAQHEIYLVLDPETYGLNTYGRQARLVVYPDLRDPRRYETFELEPGSFVCIPPGMGHRGMDVFVNVITIPGFKPHNEYYIDRDIHDRSGGTAPCNEDLFGIKNYADLEAFL